MPANQSKQPHQSRLFLLIGLLLLLQAVALFTFNMYNFAEQFAALSKVDPASFAANVDLSQLPATVQDSIKLFVTSIFFIPLAVPAFLAAFGFFFRRRLAWVLAMLTQVIGLIICLLFYSEPEMRTYIIYPVMVYCIMMTLLINAYDIRIQFFPAETLAQEENNP